MPHGRADIKGNPSAKELEKGKRRIANCSINFAAKKNRASGYSLFALYNGTLKTVFGPSEMLLPLDTNHLRQQPGFFAKCFQEGSWDRACCQLLYVISFFLLPLYRCLGISTFHSLSAVLLLIFTTPWSPQLCLSWPSSLASAGPSSPLLRT